MVLSRDLLSGYPTRCVVEVSSKVSSCDHQLYFFFLTSFVRHQYTALFDKLVQLTRLASEQGRGFYQVGEQYFASVCWQVITTWTFYLAHRRPRTVFIVWVFLVMWRRIDMNLMVFRVSSSPNWLCFWGTWPTIMTRRVFMHVCVSARVAGEGGWARGWPLRAEQKQVISSREFCCLLLEAPRNRWRANTWQVKCSSAQVQRKPLSYRSKHHPSFHHSTTIVTRGRWRGHAMTNATWLWPIAP